MSLGFSALVSQLSSRIVMITFYAIIHEIWLVYGLHIQQEKA